MVYRMTYLNFLENKLILAGAKMPPCHRHIYPRESTQNNILQQEQ